ncbi:MAG: MotA/TolQ/ExbB proton channel family protein [Candidatus Azobacteroides sp.]|nr:MotA/TolQ/ExbB proton channel family protein [Candidatus Azobacteroides sp.]
MKRYLFAVLFSFAAIGAFPLASRGQDSISLGRDSILSLPELFAGDSAVQDDSIHQIIKIKFIEGSPLFMGLIALVFIMGLTFCLERIIYLNFSQINTGKLLTEIELQLNKGDLESAKNKTRDTRGPVASIAYQALARIDESIDVIEKSIISYGSVQAGLLEKNLSWITLFIAVAPSLGFLGTVLGMIESFDRIQFYGDINPSIVAGGMKVALITTVGGLIVAIILQFFYNYILTKIEGILSQMEDDSIHILDLIIQYKKRYQSHEIG